ncbi:transcription-repair coupling factor, partial [PVC group bacterium]|nr:transcription-repair coupling factor [PVC group bacterium]
CFICEELSVVVAAESDLYGRRKTLSRKYMPTSSSRRVAPVGTRVTDFTDMEPGDLVVHVEYGIGRYLGQKEILFNNQRQEVLAIEYADNAKLYVPMSQSHLLSRYVGVSRHAVRLHRLSGKRWSKEKSEAQQSILDMAAELLDVQAARDALRGHTFPKDNAWQHEFENSFPFRETPDQYTVIRAVKRDMESKRPMDRLVCGDAGYGKTEVAVRAAFKAVNNGKQAAMLVPTTVLAQQHYNTFTERMSGYPFTIHNLSRFRTSAQRTKTIEGLKEGTVDIVIGTHALLQPNISFKDLGLVIIDEEQRFGVEHKERLKKVKQLVDVLTLTATPIPRTLYMSMTGARDMSLLQTPPRERMAIETIVTKDTNETIRKAILREVNRDGQVFFLYNRVQTIQRAKERLMKIVPDVRIAVAHGQMKSSELSSIMRSFSAGEYDLLLCTTIIESGMDIPRVNTILIDRADRFGLADLYQLRGRVGRSRHKAYAYLLLPSHGFIESNARERIGAIRKHSGLGAGFNLALRDLEIRGSGNILGAAQSGHITAIGFGLYCQLLKRSIANLKGEKTTNIIETEIRLDFIRLAESGGSEKDIALIPYEYIQEEAIRIGAYRRIAEATDASELKDLKDELHDRFGPSPPSVDRLIRIAGIRLAASKRKIQIVDVKNGKVRLFCNGEHLMESGRFPELSSTSTDEKLNELLCIIIDQN